MSRSRSKPIFEFTYRCMCGRPKKNKRGYCELCKSLSLRNPLAGYQYKWLEHQKANPPINSQIKDLGFGELNKVCGQCVHCVKHTFDDWSLKSGKRRAFTCDNTTTREPWNPFWPACHNFQERPSTETPAPKCHKLEVHEK